MPSGDALGSLQWQTAFFGLRQTPCENNPYNVVWGPIPVNDVTFVALLSRWKVAEVIHLFIKLGELYGRFYIQSIL